MSFHYTTYILRCGQPVYPTERLEPLAGQHYHPQCFRCWECQTKLTLATFCSDSTTSGPGQEAPAPASAPPGQSTRLFCRAHQPKQDKVILCKFSTRRSSFPAFAGANTE